METNKLIGPLNKHQSEAQSTVNTEINELKLKIHDIKEK
jgi:hypothetical protein